MKSNDSRTCYNVATGRLRASLGVEIQIAGSSLAYCPIQDSACEAVLRAQMERD